MAPPLRAHPRVRADARGRGHGHVKVFLNVSREEQRNRLQERIDDPEKRWKFRRDDLEVRERFDDWIEAWDDAVTETSTEWAPWYVVPADRNWVKALAVAELVAADARGARPAAPRAGRAGSKDSGSSKGETPSRPSRLSAATSESSVGSRRRGGLQQDARRQVGWAAARDELDRLVEVDLDVGREHGGCVEVVTRSAESVKTPGEDLCRLVDVEVFELCRSHQPSPLS